MCNAVCVGIGQFFGPIAIAMALAAIVGAILSAIGNVIAADMRASRARAASARATKEREERELALLTMPLKDLEAEYEAAREFDRNDDDPLRHADGYQTKAKLIFPFIYARRSCDSHPDAKLFPRAVLMLNEIKVCQSVLAWDPQHFRGELTRASSECGWGWSKEEIEARVEKGMRNYAQYAPYWRDKLEKAERELAAERTSALQAEAAHRAAARQAAAVRHFFARLVKV
jgi:hypothetical protein